MANVYFTVTELGIKAAYLRIILGFLLLVTLLYFQFENGYVIIM